MNPVSIRRAWIEAFPNSAPAGFICRTAAAERWLRTHSLSNSKRYPDSEQELAEVLLRYNTVATQVIGQDASCVLFIARFGNERQWRNDEQGPLSGFELLHVMSHGEGVDSVQFFATSVTWRAGELASSIPCYRLSLTTRLDPYFFSIRRVSRPSHRTMAAPISLSNRWRRQIG